MDYIEKEIDLKLRVLKKHLEHKKEDIKYMVENNVDGYCFEDNTIRMLTEMKGLKYEIMALESLRVSIEIEKSRPEDSETSISD